MKWRVTIELGGADGTKQMREVADQPRLADAGLT
jgi:hypothetical protein